MYVSPLDDFFTWLFGHLFDRLPHLNWSWLRRPKQLWAETLLDWKLSRGSLRHRLHYTWNQSPLNWSYSPWISDCECCCICKEDD